MRLAARAFVLSGLVFVGVLCLPAVAGAVDRVVDDDKVQCPTAPFASIQAAVTAANPGDRVLVCDGVYPEQVTIAKSNLRLVAKVVQAAIIQAPPVGVPNGIVQVTGAGVSGVEVSRFVIERGPTSGSAPTGLGVNGGASLRTARNNLIRGAHAGVRVDSDGSAPDVSYNTIQEYIAAGVVVEGATASATLSFNTIIGQPSSFGISFQLGAKGSAVGNRIVGNDAHAGINLATPAPSGVSLTGNQVFDNSRGISLGNTSGALIASNRVSRNQQAGIFVSDSLSTGNTFDRNDARSNGGPDCFDVSTGSGTAGTANTWTFNRGIDPSPPGICTP